MSAASFRRPTVIALVGPTAVGKTVLSLEIAEALRAEIVSVDSRQVYQGMDIGTAKPTAAERARVRHHLLDVVAPDAEYSVALYRRQAHTIIARLRESGKPPLLVGGTGLYFRAVCDGLVLPPVPPQPELRAEWEARVAAGDLAGLVAELRRLDPVGADRVDLANPRRVIRALEVTKVSGRPFSSWQQRESPPFQTLWLGLTRPRAELYERINARVVGQIEAGFVDEVRGLVERGYDYDLPAMQAIGYREIGWYLQGRVSLDDAIASQQQATRRYARRQLTWFRPDERIRWLPASTARTREFLDAVRERQ
ncbi:MAG: tRNA (adenosine(37)-N6)-dimethylallyltransferase MiaA [Dehalococcoidia bacterium]|nr:tRNA (adenosine(37)-N6)-dimethylallyltransferase MiaA [Dehalococcoidia bacterium]